MHNLFIHNFLMQSTPHNFCIYIAYAKVCKVDAEADAEVADFKLCKFICTIRDDGGN